MSEKNNNPKGLKAGDEVILEQSNNGIPKTLEGSILKVKGKPNARTRTYTVEAADGRNYTLYLSGQGRYNDIVSFADRKSKAKSLRRRITSLTKELKEMEALAFELEQFETDEDFVAYKLAKIFKAGTDEEKMSKLLKEMKSSNLL